MANKKNKHLRGNGHRHTCWLKRSVLKYKRYTILHTIRRISTPIAKQTSIPTCSQQAIPATSTSSTSSNTIQPIPPTSSTASPNVNVNDSHTPSDHTVTIEGSRIINIEKLSKYINDITIHSSKCGGNITLTGEKRFGLASVLSSKCQCGYEISLETSKKVKGPNDYQ